MSAEDVQQQYREEAERLAMLPVAKRKEAMAVHWRIAQDATLSDVTREYARRVAEALETELARKKPSE
jgi:TPP-dependent pyruvate/acetoin dehydrogenase alpha subunit